MHMRKLPEEGKRKTQTLLIEFEGTVLGIHTGPGIVPSIRMGNLTCDGALGTVLRRAFLVRKN